ncbi:MAG TPA: glycosyltransferase family 4 protein [Dehalococcoidia bacterium]|nr:glycosyltransferase family 4 protein [Dehalococcoidia bacterium]
MKIGYFIGCFPYKDSLDDSGYFKRYIHAGQEVVAYYLARGMARRGHQIDCFTTSIDSKDSLESYDNLNIHRYGTQFRIATGTISLKLLFKPLQHEVEIVHAHSPNPHSDLAAWWYSIRMKRPLVITYHGDLLEGFGGSLRWASLTFYNKVLLPIFLSHAKLIILPSEHYIDESRYLRKYQHKITVIPNGVNIQDMEIPCSKGESRKQLGLPADASVLLFVGKLSPYKGPDVLIRSLPLIIERVPHVKLVIAGSGFMQKDLEGLVSQLGIEEHVRLAGFVEESVKLLYYKAADVFVLPSTQTSEVFPVVLLEASAARLPMVVSDLQTFKCIIEDGYNGIVTQRGNVEGLARAISNLLQNPDIRSRMAENARKHVERFSWDGIAEESENVYQRIVGYS